ARDDAGCARESRPERSRDPNGDFRRQVDVDEPRDRIATEETRRSSGLPDQALVDLRAGLDLLVGVDAHARHDDALGADRYLVADGHALVDAHVRADVARAPENRALDERAPTDVRRRIDDGPHDAGALTERDAVREDGVRADARARSDPAVVADVRRSLDLVEIPDLDPFAEPDVAANADAGDVEAHVLVERVEVGLAKLVEVPDVLPVAVHRIAVDGPSHVEEV